MLQFVYRVGRFVKSFSPYMMLKDKLANVEIERRYGTMEWAQRDPKTEHDIEAPKVNANVYIATRAISDAIKSLPVNITQVETIRGIERQVDDNDHPANELLMMPNPEHTWSEVVDHIVKSYLNDGNAILSIERMTGPNGRIEIWPRDPRTADINTGNRSYRFGKYSRSQKVYPRKNVIHIRDMDVDDPFWGIGRINTVREEIMTDYFVNRFNSNFFRHGATLNLMFTPDKNLSEDQHLQILDAMSSEIGGAEKAFKIFINRYAGKFEYPDQKHKDIAFLDLLTHNREKIFGVFGLPPFRGGVMEYANYANALAQDKDFWVNTVAPILKVIEDALNKQLLWPIYGLETRLKFDLDSVPAIKGDQTAIEDRLLKLEKQGIVSKGYVREQLSIDEDAAPDVPDNLTPDGEEEQPGVQRGEREEVENALFNLFRTQRNSVLNNLNKITAGGSMMSVLCDPDTQASKLYDITLATKSTRDALSCFTHKMLMERGTKVFCGTGGAFNMDHEFAISLLRKADFKAEDIVEQNLQSLCAVLKLADRYGWDYRRLQKGVRKVFSLDAVSEFSATVAKGLVQDANHVIGHMKNQADSTLDNLINNATM